MDSRDLYLQQHHRRRLAIAEQFSQERQLLDAQRHLAIAIHQHRLAYACLMQCWLADITRAEK